MQPTEFIRKLAAEEIGRLQGLICHGFRGVKRPLPVPGWYVHMNGKGECRELTYEMDGTIARYDLKLDN